MVDTAVVKAVREWVGFDCLVDWRVRARVGSQRTCCKSVSQSACQEESTNRCANHSVL